MHTDTRYTVTELVGGMDITPLKRVPCQGHPTQRALGTLFFPNLVNYMVNYTGLYFGGYMLIA